MQALLSFDQAPALSVPARFFLTAPYYGALVGGLLLWQGETIFISRWSPEVLALTHLLTIGLLLQIMMGALFQVLPVLAGANIYRPLFWARLLHPVLNIGTLALAIGFWLSLPVWLALGGALVLGAVLVFLILTAIALWQIPNTNATLPAIKLALCGLFFTVLLGSFLLAVYAFGAKGQASTLTAQHITFGLIAWSGLLLLGVAYVVVPMFQLTPGYSRIFSRLLAPSLAVLVIFWYGAQASELTFMVNVIGTLIVLLLTGFAGQTLRLQQLSKRPRVDASFRFWQLGMLMLIVVLSAWFIQLWWPSIDLSFFVGIAALIGVLSSVTAGMLYKILPFLAWMHMQNYGATLGIRRLPHMGSYLSDVWAWRHFWIHAAALGFSLAACLSPAVFSRVAGAFLLIAFILLGYNLLTAVRRFVHTRERLVPLSVK